MWWMFTFLLRQVHPPIPTTLRARHPLNGTQRFRSGFAPGPKSRENKVQNEVLIKISTQQSSWITGDILVQLSGAHRELLPGANTGVRSCTFFPPAGWPGDLEQAGRSITSSNTEERGVTATMENAITLQQWQTGAPSLNTWLMEIADRWVCLQSQLQPITSSSKPLQEEASRTTTPTH